MSNGVNNLDVVRNNEFKLWCTKTSRPVGGTMDEQCMADELKLLRTRVERAELRIQMLTDSFVVAGLWRTSSSLEEWKHAMGSKEEDMLQFEMID